jgi:hypothetical protein
MNHDSFSDHSDFPNLSFSDPVQQAAGYGQEPFKSRGLTLIEEKNIDRDYDPSRVKI